MSDLKPCPCGKAPTKIHVVEGHDCKFAWAQPDCCGEWSIEFRTHYEHEGSIALQVLADAAWNEAPRKDEG